MKIFTILFILFTILLSCGKPVTKATIESKPSYYKFNAETIKIKYALMSVTNEKGQIITTSDSEANKISIKVFFYDNSISLAIYDTESQHFVDEWNGVFLDSTENKTYTKCKDFRFLAKNESYIILRVLNDSEILEVEIKSKERDDKVVFSTASER